MNYTAKLVYGSDTLNLNDGSTYGLMPGWSPPGPVRSLNIAAGTFRNRGGGKVVGRQPKDRYFTFTVQCMGTSAAETHSAANRLQWFLDRCADPSHTLYLEYCPSNAAPYTPIYGQGGIYRYEIKDSPLSMDDRYSQAQVNEQAIFVTATCLIGPYAEGLKQRVGSAVGGIVMNTFTSLDGFARGLMIGGADTNLHTNPVAGAALTNWVANGAGTTTTRITDDGPRGLSSTCVEVMVGDVAGAGVLMNSTNRMAVTGDAWYTASVFLKGISKDSYDFSINIAWYNAGAALISTTTGSTQAGTLNWKRYFETAQAPTLATTAFVSISRQESGVQFWRVTGIQFEAKTRPTPPFHGAMLGCAWSGTEHASTSTRTAGRWRTPGNTGQFNPAQGTIRFAWTPESTGTSFSDNVRLLDTTGSTLRFIWEYATNKWNLYDGMNSALSSATSFGITPYIFHITWGPGNLKAYLDGAVVCNGSTYTAQAAPAQVYLGSSDTATSQCGGTFHMLDIFDRTFSAAEVAADAADETPRLTGGDGLGQMVGGIPWLWTKDGDDQTDDCIQGTTYHNYAIFGGIPGSEPAFTEITGILSSNFSTILTLWLSVLPLDDFIDPVNFYAELGGTGDVNSSGTAYYNQSIGTAEVTAGVASQISLNDTILRQVQGKDFHLFARVYDTSTTLQGRVDYTYGSLLAQGDLKAVTAASAWRTAILPHLAVLEFSPKLLDSLTSNDVNVRLRLSRSAGTADARIDYYNVMFNPLVKLRDNGSTSLAGYYYNSNSEAFLVNVSSQISDKPIFSGNEIRLVPHKINILTNHMGDTDSNPVITYTNTLSKVTITPRWALV